MLDSLSCAFTPISFLTNKIFMTCSIIDYIENNSNCLYVCCILWNDEIALALYTIIQHHKNGNNWVHILIQCCKSLQDVRQQKICLWGYWEKMFANEMRSTRMQRPFFCKQENAIADDNRTNCKWSCIPFR